MRHLPRYHRELVRSGYIAEGLEYASYPALWRALSSGPVRPTTAVTPPAYGQTAQAYAANSSPMALA